MADIDLITTPVAKIVIHFSLAYQYYIGKNLEQRRSAATLISISEKEDMERCAAWAGFYSDLSSRAAHHYNSIIQGKLQSECTELHTSIGNDGPYFTQRSCTTEKRLISDGKELQLMNQASLLSPKSTTDIKVTINNDITTVGKMEAKSIITEKGKISGDPNVMSDSFLRFKQRNLELCCTETE